MAKVETASIASVGDEALALPSASELTDADFRTLTSLLSSTPEADGIPPILEWHAIDASFTEAAPDTLLEIGEEVADRYTIGQRISAACVNTQIYSAFDQNDGSEVAFKLLHEPDTKTRNRARKEIAAGMLLTPFINFPQLKDCGYLGEEHGFRRYLALPFAQQGTLTDFLSEKPNVSERLQAAMGMGVRVASALNIMHRGGIAHRDIKPRNILRYDGINDWRLCDFGMTEVSKTADYKAPFARMLGRIAVPDYKSWFCADGTVSYLPPEAFKDGNLPLPAGDAYQFGTTLHVAVTGKLPALNSGAADTVSVKSCVPETPEAFSDLIAACREFEPEKRLGMEQAAKGLLDIMEKYAHDDTWRAVEPVVTQLKRPPLVEPATVPYSLVA